MVDNKNYENINKIITIAVGKLDGSKISLFNKKVGMPLGNSYAILIIQENDSTNESYRLKVGKTNPDSPKLIISSEDVLEIDTSDKNFSQYTERLKTLYELMKNESNKYLSVKQPQIMADKKAGKILEDLANSE